MENRKNVYMVSKFINKVLKKRPTINDKLNLTLDESLTKHCLNSNLTPLGSYLGSKELRQQKTWRKSYITPRRNK